MRKALILLVLLLLLPTTLLAQDWRGRRGRHRDDRDYPRTDMFELTPFGGYSYGGTIFADQAGLFNHDVRVASHADFGVDLGIPVSGTGMKIELMVSRQATHLTNDRGIFGPDANLANFAVTYYQGGLQVPLADPRRGGIVPFVVATAGVANLDPDIPGTSAANRFSASAGIGVKVPINRNLGLRLETRGFYTSTSNNHDNCRSCYSNNRDLYQGETNLGLVLSF